MAKMMRALVFDKFLPDPKPVLKEVPIPTPGPGEVLVKMEAAPINPSDLNWMKGVYGIKPDLPAIGGFEGSGTVVGSGSGMFTGAWKGKRVSCVADFGKSGTWAEYLVTKTRYCTVLKDYITYDQGATFFINPMTAQMFAEKIAAGKHKAAIQTAAASSLGKMMVKWGEMKNFPIINIVRRAEQVEMLKQLGAIYILNSTSPTFKEELSNLCKALQPTIAFDAVSGELTGVIMNAMPDNSIYYVYGALSGQDISGISTRGLYFGNKMLGGLWVTPWMQNKTSNELFWAKQQVRMNFGSAFRSEIIGKFPLGKYHEAIKAFSTNTSNGKVILNPSQII